jgi:hypothetical protein
LKNLTRVIFGNRPGSIVVLYDVARSTEGHPDGLFPIAKIENIVGHACTSSGISKETDSANMARRIESTIIGVDLGSLAHNKRTQDEGYFGKNRQIRTKAAIIGGQADIRLPESTNAPKLNGEYAGGGNDETVHRWGPANIIRPNGYVRPRCQPKLHEYCVDGLPGECSFRANGEG